MDPFSPGGMLLKRLIRGGVLDQRGSRCASRDFGPFGGDLLIGKHRNGQINAFDPRSRRFLGTLRLGDESPLWPQLVGPDSR